MENWHQCSTDGKAGKYTFAVAAELTLREYFVANFVLEVPRKYVMHNCPLCLLIVFMAALDFRCYCNTHLWVSPEVAE